MRRLTSTFFLASILVLAAAACGDDDSGDDVGDDDDDGDDDDGSVVEVTEAIEASETWTADKTYILKDHIFVTGGTLTIEAGTTVKGDEASSLVVTPDAKLEAVGTADAPIVFTSAVAEGGRAAGDWGGVVMLGRAPINVDGGVEAVEGFPAGTANTEYGGDDATHDCGTIEYARIEFAGFQLAVDNELNALTLAGCGSDTTIDHLQTHMGADDGVEVFGGSVVIKHLLVTQPDDDGLDSDFGWVGGAQFVIIQQNALVGDKGFEWDSNKDNNAATPVNAPEIWNATMIGSDADPGEAGKTQAAMHIRRGSAGSINNTIVAHFADFAVNVSDFSSAELADMGDLQIASSYFFDNANDSGDGWPTDFDVFNVAAMGDPEDLQEDDCETPNTNCLDEAAVFSTGNTFDDPELEDPTNLSVPNFAPAAGSPVLSGGATPPSGFDTSATFIGAIGDDDWTAGWTAYPAD
jgi:hypothetical protein